MLMTDTRLEELQIKVAFLEDTLNKLSDEFYHQQRVLDELQTKYLRLQNRLQEYQHDENSDRAILDEKPPHY
jgi:uncharacterized coiled-coil protein SlyX